ncbi:MAG: DNA-methyltransferase [Nitrospinota bacterium]
MLLKADAAFLPLKDESVQCIVTSPPYWSLRKYEGMQERVWPPPSVPPPGGGRQVGGCAHEWGDEIPGDLRGGSGPDAKECYGGGDGKTNYARQVPRGNFCLRCGAWRGALGLEPTPELYLEHLMVCLREMRRVLRKDGTLFLNLGDNRTKDRQWQGLPQRILFAAIQDGWRWEDEIVWFKINAMPESQENRTTRAHDYIYVLNKSRKAFWDADAVREPFSESTEKRIAQATFWQQGGGEKDYRGGTNANRSARRALENLARKQDGHGRRHAGFNDRFDGSPPGNAGANLRSVWEIPTQPFPEAHFATFPEELPRRSILLSTSPYACGKCGAPWRRETKRIGGPPRGTHLQHAHVRRNPQGRPGGDARPYGSDLSEIYAKYGFPKIETLGFSPTCRCEPPPSVPPPGGGRQVGGAGRCIVLDPFVGSGTTVKVAAALGRHGVGVDLAYQEMARERAGLFS